MSTIIIIIVVLIVVLSIFFYFNIHSATKGMIGSNMDAFFKAKSEGMDLEEAINYMIFTRYALFPKKRDEFIPLYVLFQSFLENPETDKMDYPEAFDALAIMVYEENNKELGMLEHVITLMHFYESGAIFKSGDSPTFPPDKFILNFIDTIEQEYLKRTK